MKLLVLTSDPNLLKWRTLPKKRKAILAALNRTPGATWSVEFRYQPLTPVLTAKGRIDQAWYNTVSYPLFREGYPFVYLHFTPRQWKNLGLDTGIRGANQIDTDFVGESYGHSTENELRDGLNKFVQNILHEMSHQLARDTGTPDLTHAFHDEDPDISRIFPRYNMADWQPRYIEGLKTQVTLLKRIVKLLEPAYQRPLPYHWDKVTQPWSTYDRHTYPQSGVHVGTDFATPIGTPILAPADGTITRVGFSQSLGYWVEFQMGSRYLVALHLLTKPRPEKLKAGEVVGVVGATGKINGVHAHLEWWKRPMDRTLLTSLEAVAEHTEDIKKVIA